MPIYSYKCFKCKTTKTGLFPLNAPIPSCQRCGRLMQKDYSNMIPQIRYVENDSVDYDLTGKPIRYNSMRQLRRIAKEHGCRIRDDII